MPVNYDPNEDDFVSDMTAIQELATTKGKRRKALDWCLKEKWSNKDIGCIERIENGTRWGWALYLYRAGTSGPPAP